MTAWPALTVADRDSRSSLIWLRHRVVRWRSRGPRGAGGKPQASRRPWPPMVRASVPDGQHTAARPRKSLTTPRGRHTVSRARCDITAGGRRGMMRVLERGFCHVQGPMSAEHWRQAHVQVRGFDLGDLGPAPVAPVASAALPLCAEGVGTGDQGRLPRLQRPRALRGALRRSARAAPSTWRSTGASLRPRWRR